MIDSVPIFIDTLTASTSLKRLGSCHQGVGRIAAFLASEAGSYITGQTINVDGGIWIASDSKLMQQQQNSSANGIALSCAR